VSVADKGGLEVREAIEQILNKPHSVILGLIGRLVLIDLLYKSQVISLLSPITGDLDWIASHLPRLIANVRKAPLDAAARCIADACSKLEAVEFDVAKAREALRFFTQHTEGHVKSSTDILLFQAVFTLARSFVNKSDISQRRDLLGACANGEYSDIVSLGLLEAVVSEASNLGEDDGGTIFIDWWYSRLKGCDLVKPPNAIASVRYSLEISKSIWSRRRSTASA
jgi:hypothetical protein